MNVISFLGLFSVMNFANTNSSSYKIFNFNLTHKVVDGITSMVGVVAQW